MHAIRYSCSIQLDNDRIASLLWFDKIIIPIEMANAAIGLCPWEPELNKLVEFLIESNFLNADIQLIETELLKSEHPYEGNPKYLEKNGTEASVYGLSLVTGRFIEGGFVARDFSNYLLKGGIKAVPTFDGIHTDFNKEYSPGKSPCLSIITNNFPKIQLKKIDFKEFIAFLKDEKTIKLKSRIYNWANKIERENLKASEIQDLIATNIDDYKTWIVASKFKYDLSSFESIFILAADFLENLLKLKLSTAVKNLIEFKKRKLKLELDELNAPGRELAYICHVNKIFENQI